MTRAVAALLFVVATTVSSTSQANGGGIFTLAGERATATCRNCHGSAGPEPEVGVTGIPAGFVSPDASLLLTFSVRKATDSVGVAAGFGVSTTSAGIFRLGTDNGVRLSSRPGLDNEAGHTAPRAYVDGLSSWQLSLTDLREGRHTIFVAGNDVNGDSDVAGDHVNTIRVPLLVCDATRNSDGDSVPDGCDLCPDLANVDQADGDEDTIGDACDNCPAARNPDQRDLDEDTIGDVCDDVTDECARGLDDCDALATCTDTAGTGFVCTCPTGYDGDGATCDDVDECLEGSDDCDDDAVCDNTEGGFTCTCLVGYVLDGAACVDLDECADGSNDCDDDAVCDNTDGGFTCTCDTGYVGDGTVCIDIDECADGTAVCGGHSVCVNSPGAYACPCDPGFNDGNTRCFDIDECSAADACGENEVCANSEGGFECSCLDGFVAEGDVCAERVLIPFDNEGTGCIGCTSTGASSSAMAALLLLLRRRRQP